MEPHLRRLALQQAGLHAVRLHGVRDAHVRRRYQALRDPPVPARQPVHTHPVCVLQAESVTLLASVCTVHLS